MVEVKYEQIHPDAQKPKKSTKKSAGYDLFCVEDIEILPRDQRKTNLGFKIGLPPGTAFFILPKSGIVNMNWVTVANSPGLVDEDYPDEVGCLLINHHPFQSWKAKKGQKIAQAVIMDVKDVNFIDGEVKKTTERSGGFGSTGLLSQLSPTDDFIVGVNNFPTYCTTSGYCSDCKIIIEDTCCYHFGKCPKCEKNAPAYYTLEDGTYDVYNRITKQWSKREHKKR